MSWFIAHPRYVILMWVTISCVSLFAAAKIRIDTTTSSFLDRSGPLWNSYQRSVASFGGDEFISIMVGGGTPFAPETISHVEDISSRLRDLPGVRRVDSIASYPLIREKGGEIVWGSVPQSLADGSFKLQELQTVLAMDAVATGNLASADGRWFVITAVLDGDIDGSRAELISELDDAFRLEGAAISGVPVFRTKVNQRTAGELVLLVPVTIGILSVLLLLAFGSVSAIVANLICALAGTLVALGAMGALSIPVSLATMTVPPILLALGSAYTTHVIAAIRVHDNEEFLGAQSVARPIALSGLTTALGFLAMATVRVDAIRELGVIGAIGSIAVSAASLSLAPVVLSALPVGRRGVFERVGSRVSGVCIRAIRYPRIVVASWVVLALTFGSGISRMEIDTDIIRWFPERDPVRQDYEKIRHMFSGITPLNVMVEATGKNPVTDPASLDVMDSLVSYLALRSDVGRVIGVPGVLRRMNEVFAGEAVLPRSTLLAEQYLGMLSGLDYVDALITADRRAASISVRMDVNGSNQILGLSGDIQEWWSIHGIPGYRLAITGIMFEFARAQEAIAFGQIRGLAIAFCAVVLALALVLRSSRESAMACLPNIVPVVIAFGTIGWLRIPLDAASACMGAVALGIAVDDTMHVCSWYKDYREAGVGARDAMAAAIERACPALLCTTALITAGFCVLGFSSFVMVSHFGLITASVVGLCLLADLSLLPVLLVFAARERSNPGAG